MHDITVSPIMGTLSNWLLIILRWYPIIWSPNLLFLINQNVQSLHTTIVGVCKFKVGDSLPKNNKNNYCSTLFSITSVVWSTHKSYLSKCKDTVLKYYLSKRESHSYEKYLSESPKVSDIKCKSHKIISCTSKNELYTYLHVCILWVDRLSAWSVIRFNIGALFRFLELVLYFLCESKKQVNLNLHLFGSAAACYLKIN